MKFFLFNILTLLISINRISAQNFDENINFLKTQQLENINLNTTSIDSIEKWYLIKQISLLTNFKVDSTFLYTKKGKKVKLQIIKNILNGDYHLFKKIPEDSIALNSYKIALDIAVEKKDTTLITEVFKKIITQLNQNRETYSLSKYYLDKYKPYCIDNEEQFIFNFYQITNNAALENKEKIKELKLNLKKYTNSKNNFIKAKHHQMVGVFYYYFLNNKDSALYHMKKAQSLFESKPYHLYKNELFGVYGNIGQYIEDKGELELAKIYYTKANNIKIPKYKYLVKVKLNDILANSSVKQKKYDSAFYYLKQSNFYRDTLNEYGKAKTISELNKKYKTAEKEKQILIEKQKKEQNRYLFLGTLSFLILSSGIAFLNLKNSRKKRLLAEQEQELQKQKNLTLLKEQEINTINAMINGQEKERVRIAEDLHDNIGSVLATLKLHFENLKLNREKKHFNQDELYQKTEKLIDETYLKVRNIAHAKNAGVIANKGLLIAVKLMAEKISDANKITIYVLDFGLDKRLESKIEITLFRIIQELITNIIKHADATEATINIALYDQNLNIIIEDNGKGFTYDKTALSNGIGLSSIVTRVQHLNGTFTIDSTISKGTSIIINIPIA